MSENKTHRREARAKLLTVEQVAEELAVCSKTVRRHIASGSLISHRIGRLVRVAEDDLARFRTLRRG